MILRRCYFAALGLMLCVAFRAHAFNELGHYLSARLAYDQLSAAQREAVHEALQKHPHYAEYLAANVPSLATEREWAFLRAATWADWVRSRHRAEFHKSEWHYINYPYVLKQPLPAVLPEPLEQPGGNILRQLTLAKQVASDPRSADLGLGGDFTSEQKRALAFTWLFHLTGDLHQPLHVVALIDDQRFPRETHGDQGGNKLAIVAQGSRPIRLHAFWDGALGSDSRYENVVRLAESLRSEALRLPVTSPEFSSHVTSESWAKESYELAVREVYLNGELQIAEWKPAYESAAEAGPEVPVFSDALKERARAVSQQRLILAGRRLARQIQEILP